MLNYIYITCAGKQHKYIFLKIHWKLTTPLGSICLMSKARNTWTAWTMLLMVSGTVCCVVFWHNPLDTTKHAERKCGILSNHVTSTKCYLLIVFSTGWYNYCKHMFTLNWERIHIFQFSCILWWNLSGYQIIKFDETGNCSNATPPHLSARENKNLPSCFHLNSYH